MVLQVLTEWEERVAVSRPPASFQLEREFMKNLLMRLWKEEEGQDLTEYALLLVLLSLAAIGSLGSLANAINKVFNTAAGNLNTTT
jgi:pilus assembly protein Flp/PilA